MIRELFAVKARKKKLSIEQMLLLLKILVVFLNASGCLQLDAGAFVVLELSPYFQFSNVTVGHALLPFRYHKNNYH